MAGHCEGPARREALQRRACVREDDRSSRAVGVRLVLAHDSSRLLTDEECAERRVPNRFEHHVRVGFRNLLAKDPWNAPVDVMDDKRGSPEFSNKILEQPLHGCWLACIACVSAYVVRLLQSLQDQLVWSPGGNGDTHTALCKQPGATRADAGAAADDQCNVLYGGLRVGHFGLCHFPSRYHVSPKGRTSTLKDQALRS